MTIDINEHPVGTFLRLSVQEYKKEINTAQLSPKLLDEVLDRAAHAWFAARKPKVKRKASITDETEWIKSLKDDPALQGVQIDTEVAKCQFWCRNQTPPVPPTRRRIVNWLNRADRVVGTEKTRAPLPYPGPPGWLEWCRENTPNWVRFTAEEGGTLVPPWHMLWPEERKAIQSQMKDGK